MYTEIIINQIQTEEDETVKTLVKEAETALLKNSQDQLVQC